jgi:hypothetical protein
MATKNKAAPMREPLCFSLPFPIREQLVLVIKLFCGVPQQQARNCVTWKAVKPSPLAPLPQATVYTQVIKPSQVNN